MRVLMIPGEGQEGDRTTGISQVVYKYIEYLKKYYDVEFVNIKDEYDLIVGHAGITGKSCDVSILHGIYWTGDYEASKGEYAINAKIADSVRAAKEITVPSEWVKKTIERDLRISPTVIHHGIEWDEWQEKVENRGYILWNKNRLTRICDPYDMQKLAEAFPKELFVSTFSYDNAPKNIKVIGKKPFDDMKKIVKSSNIYLSLVKETFGIGTLEAMASGIPVLGWDIGGNTEIVEHGVSGYLAEHGNYKDLENGLNYCLKHRDTLGENARERARQFTWKDAVEKLYKVLQRANKPVECKVSVIVPVYNYADKLERSVGSVCEQTLKPHEVIIVDDGSKDDPEKAVNILREKYKDINIKFIQQENSGVAIARNTGFKNSTGDYICCLDPDDMIKPDFLRTCVKSLEENPDAYVAYTRLWYIKPDGEEGISNWLSDGYDYDKMLKKQNQVPTCNVARRSVWERLGGQRQRYAPMGAGSEDAEMWLRAGAHGMRGILATNKPLFVYSWMSGIVSGNKNYKEVDFRLRHPYVNDGIHPFASLATPANKLSHKVFQYDESFVSIIVPVAERHLDKLVDNLDSIEGQSFRRWEIVVVDDSSSGIDDFIKNAYPFVTWAKTPKPESGAAKARNIGCELAKSDLLLFLDADDEFAGEKSLENMMKLYQKTGDIIYTDYIIKLKFDSEEEAKNKYPERFYSYNEYTKETFVNGKALSYTCKRAQEDLDYNWCIISCLVPKDVHNDVGGFDEELKILEDIDYFKRIAKKGHCFEHLKESCFIIDRTRPMTEEKPNALIKKTFRNIKIKLERIENMACNGCGNRSSEVSKDLSKIFNDSYQRVISKSTVNTMNDEDFIRCKYNSQMRGDHMVVGSATNIKYGYKSGGSVFLVHKKDVQTNPNKFQPISRAMNVRAEQKERPAPPPPPKPNSLFGEDVKDDDTIEEKIDKEEIEKAKEELLETRAVKINKDKMTAPITKELLSEFGVIRYTENIYNKLKELGIETVGLIPTLTNEQLTSIRGIGEATANKLKENAKKYYEI